MLLLPTWLVVVLAVAAPVLALALWSSRSQRDTRLRPTEIAALPQLRARSRRIRPTAGTWSRRRGGGGRAGCEPWSGPRP